MRRFSFFPIFLLLACSCNKPTGIRALVTGSDSAAVSYYKGDGSMDSVSSVIILRNRQQLDSLAGYIESGSAKQTACGHDGAIHFFKNGIVLQQVDFRMNKEDCMHFSFSLDGKRCYTKLSEGAKLFLQSANKK